jgi:hypothetical protein
MTNNVIAVEFSNHDVKRFCADVAEFLAAPDPTQAPWPGRGESFYLRPDFYELGARLRSQVGLWDACDPVALSILHLVLAQNALALAIDDYACYRGDAATPDVERALKARAKAACELKTALDAVPDAFQCLPNN